MQKRWIGVLVWGSLACAVGSALSIDRCAAIVAGRPGEGELLAVGIGGRSSGSWLPKVGRKLGFKTIHVYPEDTSAEITPDFKPEDYDFQPIVIARGETPASVAGRLRAQAAAAGLRLGGLVPGIDGGAPIVDAVAEILGLPGNDPAENSWRSNKGLLNEYLGDRGVPVAKSLRLSIGALLSQPSPFAYPFFLKPEGAFASIGSSEVHSPAELPGAIRKCRDDCADFGFPTDEVLVQQLLHGDKIYFVNTINVPRADGRVERYVTGAWIDYRGSEFPKEVWDAIYMLPPPRMLNRNGQRLFRHMLTANQRTITTANVRVGVTHLEMMAPGSIVSSADDLKPTDLNVRPPGLRLSVLEERATGVDPAALDILSRSHPDLVAEFPAVYDEFYEHVGLVFIRTKIPGEIRQGGLDFLDSLRIPNAMGGYVTEVLVPPAGTARKATANGTSMVGVLHVAGPSRAALESIRRQIREQERNFLFVN